MGDQGTLMLIAMKVFGHDDLTAKHCYIRCSKLLIVEWIKMSDKDDWAAKH